ncbi:MAG: glycosyltransferase family 4 protein [Dehalococcoidia bacterium]
MAPADRTAHIRTTTRPVHVCIMTSVHDPFDPRIFHKQARTLAAAGYRVTLLAPADGDADVEGVAVRGLARPRRRTGRPLLWLRLMRRALRSRADLYHFHDPELLPLGLLITRLTGRPVVYDAHEYYRNEIATRGWIPRLLRRPAAELVHAIETLVARRLAAVVAVNEHMAAGFTARGARSVAVHNFPPLSYFRPAERPTSPKPVVGYVGALTRERGLEIAWEAARLLHTRLPEAEVRVIGRIDWSGARVPRDRARWRRDAGAVLAGVLPARAIPAALAGMAVGWIPFQPTPNNHRALPLKLLEYMAAGLPVVASDVGQTAAIVRASGCGIVVPAAEARAHADALARLLTDEGVAAAMGARGRAAVLARYSWEAESRRLLDLYARLAPAGPGRR